MRAALTAGAALSGWHGGRRPQGWWRHPDGSYGWVGPVFWPFADDDVTNAIIYGDATSLSLYGYGDLVGDWYSKPSPHARHHTSKMTEAEVRAYPSADVARLA